MTFDEMISEAELLYESLNSSEAPGFTQEEWGRLFTIGQRKVVLSILKSGVNRNTFNESSITALIQHETFLAAAFEQDDHFFGSTGVKAVRLKSDIAADTLSTKYFWILDEYVNTNDVDNIPIKRITYDFYRLNLRNPFRVPDETEGYWLLQYNTSSPIDAINAVPIIITDGKIISEYNIIGVHHPDNYPIVSTKTYPETGGTHASCLNPSIHYKIVEEAVTLARMSIVDQAGYQLAVTEFNK